MRLKTHHFPTGLWGPSEDTSIFNGPEQSALLHKVMAWPWGLSKCLLKGVCWAETHVLRAIGPRLGIGPSLRTPVLGELINPQWFCRKCRTHMWILILHSLSVWIWWNYVGCRGASFLHSIVGLVPLRVVWILPKTLHVTQLFIGSVACLPAWCLQNSL